jgi:hypothetical protein
MTGPRFPVAAGVQKVVDGCLLIAEDAAPPARQGPYFAAARGLAAVKADVVRLRKGEGKTQNHAEKCKNSSLMPKTSFRKKARLPRGKAKAIPSSITTGQQLFICFISLSEIRRNMKRSLGDGSSGAKNATQARCPGEMPALKKAVCSRSGLVIRPSNASANSS